MEDGPFWAALTTWAVVNAVNVLQTIGFSTRRRHGMRFNHATGRVIAALALPASVAAVGYAGAGSLWWVGPVCFDAFVVLMLLVDYLRPVQFRRPARPAILVPYLILFFGAILLMGLSMYPVERALWLVTVATTAALLGSMVVAMRQGNG